MTAAPESPASTIRRAAERLREAAQLAGSDGGGLRWEADTSGDGRAWLRPGHHSMHGFPNTVTYIALVDPDVGAALATWLDSHADIQVLRTCDERLTVPCPALTVARSILRETGEGE